MLILTRRPGEQIDITLEDGRRITVTLLMVQGNHVRCGVDAPKTVTVDRHEVTERKWNEKHPVNGNV